MMQNWLAGLLLMQSWAARSAAGDLAHPQQWCPYIVGLTVQCWQQRLSAWLHTMTRSCPSTLLPRRTSKPDGVSWLDALDTA